MRGRTLLAAALLALLLPGCLETGGVAEEGCLERAARGAALAPVTDATQVAAVDEPRLDVDDADRALSWSVTGPARTLRQIIKPGEGGVTLERPPEGPAILRAHVVVQPTDEAIAPAQSPRLHVALAQPLPPGPYRLEVCLQEVHVLPPSTGPAQVLRRDVVVA